MPLNGDLSVARPAMIHAGIENGRLEGGSDA